MSPNIFFKISNNYLSTGRKSTALFPDNSDVIPEDCCIFPSKTRKNRQYEGKTSEFAKNMQNIGAPLIYLNTYGVLKIRKNNTLLSGK